MSEHLKKRYIKDFVKSSSMEVQGVFHGEQLVMMIHRAGSMYMQFSMTVAQAREMAEALMNSAYEIEQMYIQELETQEIPND